MSKNIAILVLAIGCLLLGSLYLFNEGKDNSQYKERIVELNAELSKGRLTIREMQKAQSNLDKDREKLNDKITLHNLEVRKLDSIVKSLKVKSYEKHIDIDNADMVDISNILSGYIRSSSN